MPQLDNPRHEKFARNLANGMTGAAAYRDAYQQPGKVLRSARSMASDLLRDNPDISERVRDIQGRKLTGDIMTQQELLRWLTKGVVTQPETLDASSNLVQSVETLENGKVRLKMIDKMRAAELLAKLAGYQIDRIEIADTTPREPLTVLRARVQEALTKHSRS